MRVTHRRTTCPLLEAYPILRDKRVQAWRADIPRTRKVTAQHEGSDRGHRHWEAERKEVLLLSCGHCRRTVALEGMASGYGLRQGRIQSAADTELDQVHKLLCGNLLKPWLSALRFDIADIIFPSGFPGAAFGYSPDPEW